MNKLRTVAIAHDELKLILCYDELTGVWTWRSCHHERFNGKRADFYRDKTQTYRIVTIRKEKYYAHRLAWFYMTGEWPPDKIDHKDLNKGNNIWNNLRLSSDSGNNANKRPAPRPMPKGVDKIEWGYQARIKVNHKSIHLGTFNTPEEAHKAYTKAAKKYFGEFARTE